MNKIRRLAEDLVNRYPNLFTGDFDKNKGALAQVTIVRTRSLRNQLAGAITKIVHAQGPPAAEKKGGTAEESNMQATIEERAKFESGQPSLQLISDESSTRSGEKGDDNASSDRGEQTKTEQDQPRESSAV